MTDGSEFIRRWSRRKQAARQDAKPAVAPTGEDPKADDDAAPAAVEPQAAGDSAEAEQEAPELPDIDSLSTESDFTPFMKKGVPKELRNRAMRKLWRVNPVFGHLDGLNDYDGDFTDAATVVKGLKTLYKVGQGIVLKPDPEPEPEPSADALPADDAPEIAATEPTIEPAEPAPDADPEEPADGNKVT